MRKMSKMGAFQNLSIKWKLKLIIMLTSAVALLFASGTLMYSNIETSRKIIRDDLSSLSRVIGMNSIGAIVFYDQQTAENNLAALHAKHMLSWHVYMTDKEKFSPHIFTRTKNIAGPFPRSGSRGITTKATTCWYSTMSCKETI